MPLLKIGNRTPKTATRDIERIAGHLKMPVDEFIHKYLEVDNEDGPYEGRQNRTRLIPYIPEDRETASVKDGDDHDEVSSANRLYQFKITLNESTPAIWRRIQVQDCTLDRLHEHIQTAMGWTDSHLHQFEINGQCYAELLDDGFMDSECVDSTIMKLSDIVSSDGQRFRFLYCTTGVRSVAWENRRHRIRTPSRTMPKKKREESVSCVDVLFGEPKPFAFDAG